MGDNIINFLIGLMGASLSLAGLATIISLFRGGDKFTAEDIYIFRSVVATSLAISVLCFVPFLVFELLPAHNWLISSGAYVGFGLGFIVQGIRQIRSGQIIIVYPVMSFVLGLGTFIVFGLNILNTIVWQDAPVFLVGLLWGLVFISARLYLFLVQVTDHTLENLQ